MKGADGDSAVLAWVILAAWIVLYVVAYDLWAGATRHKTMTAEFRDWLHNPVLGPIIAGLWLGLFVGLTFHFLVKSK